MTRSARNLVTVVVVTHRAAAFLIHCLDGISAQSVPHELLVIDNNSTDGSAEILSERVPVESVHRMSRNLGFAGGVAAALPMVATPFVALLNDDAVPDPDWLERLLRVAVDDPAAAAWTSMMVLADRLDTVNNLGSALNDGWYGVDVGAGDSVRDVAPEVVDVFGFCGGATLLRTNAVLAVGGFPAEFFLYYEDLDTSWRLRRAGWTIRTVPSARVVHRHSATSDQRSALFHFYNERNRLLTLVRCAPLWVAPVQFLRFVMTTGSLTVRRLCGQTLEEENLQIGLRVRVAVAVLRMAGKQYRQRRRAIPTRSLSEAGPPRGEILAFPHNDGERG